MVYLIAVSSLACTGAPAGEGFEPALAASLAGALDVGRIEIDAPGAVLGVTLGVVGAWTGGSGYADLETDEAAAPHHRFRVGSITKTLVAAAVLQLAEEGALDLDEPVSTWLPDAPHADRVTLRQCLNHTAGYTDYVYDLEFLAAMDQQHTPEELLACIEDEELLFEPGEGMAGATWVAATSSSTSPMSWTRPAPGPPGSSSPPRRI